MHQASAAEQVDWQRYESCIHSSCTRILFVFFSPGLVAASFFSWSMQAHTNLHMHPGSNVTSVLATVADTLLPLLHACKRGSDVTAIVVVRAARG